MIDELVTVLFDDFLLAALDLVIEELDDLTTFQAHHMIMVLLVGHFEHGMTAIEIVANHQSCGFELGQYAIDGRQTDILASLQQGLVDIFGTEVAIRGAFENLQDLDAGQRDFESRPAQFMVLVGHGCSSQYRGGSGMIDQSNDSEERGQMQNLIKTVTFSVALSLIGGCSYLGVYKRDLPQGNLISQEMVTQLEPGMSRQQVQSIMGSPLLPAPFDANQWDYVFRLDEAYAGVKQRRVTLTFEGNRLAYIDTSGDMAANMELSTEDSSGPAVEGSGIGTTPQQPQNAPPGGAPSREAHENTTPGL